MKFWSVNKVDRVCEEVEIQSALFFKKQILPAHTQSSNNPKTENTLHKIALAGEKYKNLSKRNIGLPQLNNSWICMLQHIKCRQHNKTEKCRVLVEQNESSVGSGAACKKKSLRNNVDYRFNGQVPSLRNIFLGICQPI